MTVRAVARANNTQPVNTNAPASHGARAPVVAQRPAREHGPLEFQAALETTLLDARIAYFLVAPVMLIAGVPAQAVLSAGVALAAITAVHYVYAHRMRAQDPQ